MCDPPDPHVVAILESASSLKCLTLQTDDPGATFEPELLGSVSESATIETLCLKDFCISTNDSKDHFIIFLLAHRATLRNVELGMDVHLEERLWEIVATMHRKLTLESCKLSTEMYRDDPTEHIVPQLRDVIRRFGGPELAIKDDESIKWRHGVALNRYILGQPALSE